MDRSVINAGGLLLLLRLLLLLLSSGLKCRILRALCKIDIIRAALARHGKNSHVDLRINLGQQVVGLQRKPAERKQRHDRHQHLNHLHNKQPDLL